MIGFRFTLLLLSSIFGIVYISLESGASHVLRVIGSILGGGERGFLTHRN